MAKPCTRVSSYDFMAVDCNLMHWFEAPLFPFRTAVLMMSNSQKLSSATTFVEPL